MNAISRSSMDAAEFYAHPLRGPLRRLVDTGAVQSREHRLGCAVEIVAEHLQAAQEGLHEDAVLWALLAEVCNAELPGSIVAGHVRCEGLDDEA